jgi:uncharacterized cupin superfamily protein
MSEIKKPVVNIADLEMREQAHGEKFAVRSGRIGPLIGSNGIGVSYMVVPPGKRAFPFHAHHVQHELFVILDGMGEYRFGSTSYPVRAGDVCAAPPGGPEVAHQLVNTGAVDLRYLSLSTEASAEIVEYPDSNKFGASALNRDGSRWRYLGRADGGKADYWDGE